VGGLGDNALQRWMGGRLSRGVRSDRRASRDAGDDLRVAPAFLTSTNGGSSTIHRPYNRSYGTKNQKASSCEVPM
jgi:hypothetical protein